MKRAPGLAVAGRQRRRAAPWCRWCGLLTCVALGCAADARPDAGAADAAAVMDAARPTRDAALDGEAGAAGASADAGTRDAGVGRMPEVAGEDFVRYPAQRPDADGRLTLAFDTPRGAVGFVVTADPAGRPRSIALEALSGPDGETWFDAADQAPQRFEPGLRSSLNAFVPYAFMLPSSPTTPLVPGGYHVTLRVADSAEPVAVDVVFARERGEARGTLSAVLWFAPGAGWGADEARSDPRFAGAITEWIDIYAGAGIDLSVADYRDLPSEGASLAQLDDDAELAELLALLETDAPAERTLDLVFVERIVTGPEKTVRGKVSGLPGSPAHPELARRGAVIIGLSTLPASARAAGELLAHETAHFLGLRHTSEFDGLRHDLIADTPECPAERASQTGSDGMPVLSAEDCADLDGRNLLFYTPPRAGAQRGLTVGQRFVLTRYPSVR